MNVSCTLLELANEVTFSFCHHTQIELNLFEIVAVCEYLSRELDVFPCCPSSAVCGFQNPCVGLRHDNSHRCSSFSFFHSLSSTCFKALSSSLQLFPLFDRVDGGVSGTFFIQKSSTSEFLV